jgi:leader peptidase (prepilin peptidase) / N-methyltransferase
MILIAILVGLLSNFATYKIFCKELNSTDFKKYGIKRFMLVQIVITILIYLLNSYHTNPYEFFYESVLISLLVIIAFVDFKFFIVPDGLICFGLLIALIFNLNYITIYLLGVLAGLIPIVIVIAISKGGMGGGDMKLFAMIGGFMGYKEVICILYMSVIIGGAFSLFAIAFGNMTLKSRIAFAPCISLATIIFIIFREQISYFLVVYYNIWM